MAKPTRFASSTPILPFTAAELPRWLKTQTLFVRNWLSHSTFSAKPGSHCIVPNEKGHIACVLAGVADTMNLWSLAGLPGELPEGTYSIERDMDCDTATRLMLGWLLGSYRFTRYKTESRPIPVLLPPVGADANWARIMNSALCQARDLINTPANDLGPAELAAACRKTAQSYGARYSEIIGDALVKNGYPAIFEVGKASDRAPRLIDIRWGEAHHPKVTLVGKGVCFDSGGLDIKPAPGMKLMKKDMGGAACVLALAELIMASSLPVRLRVLIPAVENSISGNAYRPFDIINTRKGTRVEVGNTDAEGRLILCDALCEADSEKPDLLIDCATLTGAARTALGTDIPALFTPDDQLAADLQRHSAEESDLLWRLPLHDGYRDMLKSSAADINSAPDSSYAGAITAALYLKEFVSDTKSWAHIDMMAWNLTHGPGRPVGGEAMAVRALYALIAERFTKTPQNAGSKRKKRLH